MEVRNIFQKPAYTGKRPGQTMYYEGGKVRTATSRFSSLLQPYGTKEGYETLRRSLGPISRDFPKKSTENSPQTDENSAKSEVATPATAPIPGLDLSHIQRGRDVLARAAQTAPASPFPELLIEAPPNFYIGTRASLPASLTPPLSPRQTFSVLLTPELRSLRLELSPVKPEVPDRIPARKVYQRLINRTKPQSALGGRMRKATDPIITPHYAQLSPTLSTYGYKAGCCIEEWERKANARQRRLI